MNSRIPISETLCDCSFLGSQFQKENRTCTECQCGFSEYEKRGPIVIDPRRILRPPRRVYTTSNRLGSRCAIASAVCPSPDERSLPSWTSWRYFLGIAGSGSSPEVSFTTPCIESSGSLLCFGIRILLECTEEHCMRYTPHSIPPRAIWALVSSEC